MDVEERATHPIEVLHFTADAGDAVSLRFAGASLPVSHQRLLCCCGNTNKICCFGLTQFRDINNNKNSSLACEMPFYAT